MRQAGGSLPNGAPARARRLISRFGSALVLIAGVFKHYIFLIYECQQILEQLLAAPKFPFNHEIRSKLPSEHGLYAIYQKDAPDGDVLRAGRTKIASGGLRQRIYQNHLMGNQKGNLRSQLIADGTCSDFEQAKAWIQQNSLVQFVVVGDDRLRAWAEYFMLSILRPKHCD